MERANATLRDTTEQLKEVLLHRMRCEARVADMQKRLEVVKKNREKHEQGGWCGDLIVQNYDATRIRRNSM